jgi:hypothetical protein
MEITARDSAVYILQIYSEDIFYVGSLARNSDKANY